VGGWVDGEHYVLPGRMYTVLYDMIYLTAIGWPPGGSSSVHIYTQTIQRMSQNDQYIEQHKNTENKKNT
jgi:hypothetical protein